MGKQTDKFLEEKKFLEKHFLHRRRGGPLLWSKKNENVVPSHPFRNYSFPSFQLMLGPLLRNPELLWKASPTLFYDSKISELDIHPQWKYLFLAYYVGEVFRAARDCLTETFGRERALKLLYNLGDEGEDNPALRIKGWYVTALRATRERKPPTEIVELYLNARVRCSSYILFKDVLEALCGIVGLKGENPFRPGNFKLVNFQGTVVPTCGIGATKIFKNYEGTRPLARSRYAKMLLVTRMGKEPPPEDLRTLCFDPLGSGLFPFDLPKRTYLAMTHLTPNLRFKFPSKFPPRWEFEERKSILFRQILRMKKWGQRTIENFPFSDFEKITNVDEILYNFRLTSGYDVRTREEGESTKKYIAWELERYQVAVHACSKAVDRTKGKGILAAWKNMEFVWENVFKDIHNRVAVRGLEMPKPYSCPVSGEAIEIGPSAIDETSQKATFKFQQKRAEYLAKRAFDKNDGPDEGKLSLLSYEDYVKVRKKGFLIHTDSALGSHIMETYLQGIVWEFREDEERIGGFEILKNTIIKIIMRKYNLAEEKKAREKMSLETSKRRWKRKAEKEMQIMVEAQMLRRLEEDRKRPYRSPFADPPEVKFKTKALEGMADFMRKKNAVRVKNLRLDLYRKQKEENAKIRPRDSMGRFIDGKAKAGHK